MPGIPAILSIRFVPPSDKPESGSVTLEVSLEDGKTSSFMAATPDGVRGWMAERADDFAFGAPVLFAKDLEEETLGRSIEAMASDMSGYWLRYYNTPKGSGKGAKKGKKTAKKLKVVHIEINDSNPSGEPGNCCATIQASVEDGRQFSILAATPSWFKERFIESGMLCFFGPSVLFVRTMDALFVRRAVEAMAKDGDLWLCRYDTPRTTLTKALEDFKAKHQFSA